jgi:hypothetical protein
LEDPGIDGEIILKCMIKKYDVDKFNWVKRRAGGKLH